MAVVNGYGSLRAAVAALSGARWSAQLRRPRSHEDIACADTRPLARLARRSPRIGPGGLADLSQETHRRCVDRLQGRARRGAVLGWVDSLVKRLDERRYAGQVHTAAPGQPMVRGESEALRRTQCRMAIETARNCLHAFRRTSRRRCGIIQKPCATSKRCRLRSSGGMLHGSSPPSARTRRSGASRRPFASWPAVKCSD